MVAGLFALPGRPSSFGSPTSVSLATLALGCPPPTPCCQSCLSVGAPWRPERDMHTHMRGPCIRAEHPGLPACVCVCECVHACTCVCASSLGCVSVGWACWECVCVCMCTSAPTGPTSTCVPGTFLDIMSRCIHFRGGTHTCLCLSRSPWSPLYVITVPVFVCSSVPLTCVSTLVCSGEHIHACARSAGPIRVKECVCHVKQVSASILACEGPCLCPWVCAPRVRSVCVLLGTSTHRRSARVYHAYP